MTQEEIPFLSASHYSYFVGVTKIQCYDMTIDGKKLVNSTRAAMESVVEHTIGSKMAKISVAMKDFGI